MKNRRLLGFILLLTILVFIPKNVDAVPICLKKTKAKYETAARKVKFTYSLAKDKSGEAYYKIFVTNLDSSLVVKDELNEYKGIDGTTAIQLIGSYEPDTEYTFKIFTSQDLYECGNTYLINKKILLPYYNVYSEREECVEYEEFPLCGIHYTGSIESNSDFTEQLNEWLKENQNEVEEYKEDRNIIQIFQDFYNDHIEISVPITIILAIIVVLLLVRMIIRKVKRSKLNM